jgi:hypothetical protein
VHSPGPASTAPSRLHGFDHEPEPRCAGHADPAARWFCGTRSGWASVAIVPASVGVKPSFEPLWLAATGLPPQPARVARTVTQQIDIAPRMAGGTVPEQQSCLRDQGFAASPARWTSRVAETRHPSMSENPLRMSRFRWKSEGSRRAASRPEESARPAATVRERERPLRTRSGCPQAHWQVIAPPPLATHMSPGLQVRAADAPVPQQVWPASPHAVHMEAPPPWPDVHCPPV